MQKNSTGWSFCSEFFILILGPDGSLSDEGGSGGAGGGMLNVIPQHEATHAQKKRMK